MRAVKTTPEADLDLKSITFRFAVQFMVWVPIVVGIVHQLLMFAFDVNGIYVGLNPPGTIYPFVTLELTWWLVLTILTATLCLLTYTNRIRPHRLVTPFYIYLVFLLIWVRPI